MGCVSGLEPLTTRATIWRSPHVVQSVEPFMIVFKPPESHMLRAIPSLFVFGRLSSNEAKGVFILDLKTVFTGVFIQFEYSTKDVRR